MTEGRPELTDLIPTAGFEQTEVLTLVAAVEERSEHPMAGANVRAANAEGAKLPEVEEFSSITGFGVKARVEGREVLVGADRFMARKRINTSALDARETELARKGRPASSRP